MTLEEAEEALSDVLGLQMLEVAEIGRLQHPDVLAGGTRVLQGVLCWAPD